MAVARSDYFAVGYEVLADTGYLGLKLAEVCRRLGVTTGSFYHFFPSWTHYRRELVQHWKAEATTSQLALARTEPDPSRRIAQLARVAVGLNHRAEAGFRAWSSTDTEVRATQIEVDALRHQIVLDSALEITADPQKAKQFADTAVYLLVGYEQATLAPDVAGLESILAELISTLDAPRTLGPAVAKGTRPRPQR